MKITIHRGAAQIGGCLTEVKTPKAKILIDLGSNLPGSDTPDFSDEEFAKIIDGVDAIFYTHYHGDHVGLFAKVPSTIPQYIGEGAKEVMLAKLNALNRHGGKESEISVASSMRTFEASRPISEYGDIVITPYYCSHSAFDSYMFKIEVGEIVILHTGDFRGHGYMGKALIPMLQKFIGSVDVLITEGTMLSRRSELVKPESQLQYSITGIVKEHKYVFALCSSTDIDRLASIKAACQKGNRYLFADAYQETVLNIFSSFTTSALYDFTDKGKGRTIFTRWRYADYKAPNVVPELKRRGFVMPVRQLWAPLIKDMMGIYSDEDPILIYSMWSGYWNGDEAHRNPNIIGIRNLFPKSSIIDIHTSGHADATTLAEVCSAVHPSTAIIPIHKDAKTDFCSLNISDELKSRVVTRSTNINDIEIVIK